MAFSATAQRVVAAETRDGLDESDPAAQRSRRDLRRIHVAMGTRGIITRALDAMIGGKGRDAPTRNGGNTRPTTARPLRVLELGAGDGRLMLDVARSLQQRWPAVELTLLDRQALIEPTTIEAYAALGWNATPRIVDVLEWAEPAANDPADDPAARWDLVVSTLFLHHFEGAAFERVLGAIECRADRFFACEPRRAPLALVGSHLVGVLGANAVTREDAVLSVHAGFRDAELSTAWPGNAADWRLQEHPAGLFSHCLRAERRSQAAAADASVVEGTQRA